uniref:Uncharacterized protein n=1 Tax=Anguilla anguilla TaxID=7936 RepID=A0A0E9SKI2_ANGAN
MCSPWQVCNTLRLFSIYFIFES